MRTETPTEIATQSFDEITFGSFADLRRLCSISRSSAYGLLESGKIKSRYIGGKRYIDFESVRRLFAKAPQKPSEEVCSVMKKRARDSVEARKLAAENGSNSG